MALPDTVFGRIKVYFRREWPNRPVTGPKQKLGEGGLGFDNTRIQGTIRADLNSNEFGFADLLTAPIPRAQFTESSSLGDVRDYVIGHSNVHTIDEYMVKMNERVRLSLRDLVAELARPKADPKDVLPTHSLSQWLTESRLPRLRTELQEDLAKYLFRDIPLGELKGLLSSIQERIVARMKI